MRIKTKVLLLGGAVYAGTRGYRSAIATSDAPEHEATTTRRPTPDTPITFRSVSAGVRADARARALTP